MFNIFNYLLVGGFGLFVLLDLLMPARTLPASKLWKLRGLASAAVYLVLASYSPYLWAGWMENVRLIDASALPFVVALPLGYAIAQLVQYVWHRLLHRSDFLWRTFHQMHHSAERIDVYGALYFHPLDAIGFTFVNSFALTVVFGIAPLAAAVVGVFGGVVAIFTHANLKTPRWIGYLIARPEGHSLHHERGRHARNYGELVIWDMLFGTYENPQSFDGKNGFYDGASLRIPEMLMFRDVSEPRVDNRRKTDCDSNMKEPAISHS